MKTNFKKTKKYILDFAIKKDACSEQRLRVENSEDFEMLIQVVNDNINWVSQCKLLNQVNIKEYFPQDLIQKYELNIGVDNIGFKNSGDRNSGNWNSGDRNSGNWNSGDRNSGNWNSGDSNSGYRNSGAFCTDVNPKLWLFDKPTDISVRDWEKSEVVKIMKNIDPTIFVQSEIMTQEEKENHPKYETIGGYLKTISIHEAWENMWGNLSEENRQLFMNLPNFDSDKFKEITGLSL